jgi:hypothetical protein
METKTETAFAETVNHLSKPAVTTATRRSCSGASQLCLALPDVARPGDGLERHPDAPANTRPRRAVSRGK